MPKFVSTINLGKDVSCRISLVGRNFGPLLSRDYDMSAMHLLQTIAVPLFSGRLTWVCGLDMAGVRTESSLYIRVYPVMGYLVVLI